MLNCSSSGHEVVATVDRWCTVSHHSHVRFVRVLAVQTMRISWPSGMSQVHLRPEGQQQD
jgi:hypothetical protein